METFIKPITHLDNILSDNVQWNNVILDDKKDVKILKSLFNCILSGAEFVGHKYIWNVFNAVIDNKSKIEIDIAGMNYYCENKGLTNLFLSDILMGDDYSEDKYQDKNLMNRQILSIFKNAKYLWVKCHSNPVPLIPFLSVIKGTNIIYAELIGHEWVPKLRRTATFSEIVEKYKDANFKIEFGDDYDELVIMHDTWNFALSMAEDSNYIY